VPDPQVHTPPQTSTQYAQPANAETRKSPAFTVQIEPKWHRWRRDGKSLLDYLMDSEVHTFAFSVAANAILSFIPFIVLLYTLAKSVFHSMAMKDVVNDMVGYFIPIHTDEARWFTTNLSQIATQQAHSGLLAIIMILIACTGIFLPLEVALNQAWGVKKSRNYLMNQVVAFGLAALMVVLGISSIFINALGRQALTDIFLGHTENFIFAAINNLLLIVTTTIASILFFFSVYWVMPNCKINPWPVLRTSIWTGIVWIVSKFIFALILPFMDLRALYGPFYVSVSLLFWAYVSGLILFAGAQFSVGKLGAGKKEA